jgi:hypothetical protein
MITPDKLEELRSSIPENDQEFVRLSRDRMAEIVDTLDVLWKVARASRKWQLAPAGKESSEAEFKMAELLDVVMSEAFRK